MRTIETERLLLREILVDDADFYFKLFNSKGWLQFIGDRNIKSVFDAEKMIQNRYRLSFDTTGYGTYTIFIKESLEPIGCCGFYKRDTLDLPDLGFAFLEPFMRNGYGFESASRLIQEEKKNGNIEDYLAFTVKENKASIALLEKIGMKQSGIVTMPDAPDELLLFKNKD